MVLIKADDMSERLHQKKHTLPSRTLFTEDLSAAGNKKKLMSTS